MLNRRLFLMSSLAAVPVTGVSLQSAWAGSKPPVFAVDGIAIRGFDPVAYFDGAPMAGDRAMAVSWRGAIWQFASVGNRTRFEADPEAFAPQYGGYCAYAVSKGGTATTDPQAWTVVEGRLYLNYSTTVRGIWAQDVAGNIQRADANWPKVLEA